MEITLKIKEIALQQGHNQSTLSRAANVDYKTVQKIFQDPQRDISLSTLMKIAWVLDVPWYELVEAKGGPYPERNEK